jgi:hypothetical protein
VRVDGHVAADGDLSVDEALHLEVDVARDATADSRRPDR